MPQSKELTNETDFPRKTSIDGLEIVPAVEPDGSPVAIPTALLVQDGGVSAGHISDTDNPHNVTAEQLGIFLSKNSFPRDRNMFGVVNHPAPSTMTANSAIIPEWGRFEIPAGVGEDYRAVVSSNISFSQAGRKILFFIQIDEDSGAYSTPSLTFISATNGTENISMIEEISGLFVLEKTIPSGGFSAVTFTLTSTDAANPISGSLLHFCVSSSGGSGLSVQREVQAIENWVMDEYREGPGNLWPIEKSSMTIVSGDGSESKRVFGLTVSPDDEQLVVAYLETPEGEPALFDRCYARAVTQIDGGGSQNLFMEPVANHPGVYARWTKFDQLSGPSSYIEFIVDNAQASTNFTQADVVLKAVQVYKRPPASFYPPSVLGFEQSEGLLVHNYDGLLDVHTPLFGGKGNEYLRWQSRRYDTSGHAFGGGVGSVLEDLFYCRRVDSRDFTPVYRLTDAGLNEFAMKMDDGTGRHIGHNVHGGQARRSAPEFKINDVAKGADTRANFIADKIEWKEFTNLYNPLDGTTIIATLDTTKIWEGNVFKLKNEISFLANLDLLTLYMMMFSPYAYIDNVSANGLIFDQILMPNQGDAEYTPGGGVNATYPSETRFVASGPFGFNFDIAVQNAVEPEFRSWVQSGGSSRKFYMSALGVHDNFGLASERTAHPVTTGQSFTLETWITTSKE